MDLWNHYHVAESAKDALRVLQKASGTAKLIAGGTDFLLDLRQGRHEKVDTLVDLNSIPDMKKLEIRNNLLFIGASVSHRDITNSPLVREHGEALSKASGLIGGPQVRNVATIGGNVAHALPAADGTIALLSLDAQAEITSNEGKKFIPVADIFHAPGKNTLQPGKEILTGFTIQLRKRGQASAFNRIMRPQGVAIAILNLAVWLEMREEKIIDIRIAVGPSGPVPRRMVNAENALKNNELSEKAIELAYQAILDEAKLRTSRHRATKEYRQDMIKVLLEKTIREAAQRTRR